MTIAADQANRYSYTGNGVTTTFAYSSAFMAQADLIVTVAGSTKVLNTDYTITGTTDSVGRYPSGGSIVFGVAPANGASVVIYGDPSIAQSLDLVENDPFPAESVEKQLDTLTIFARRLKDLVTRAFRLADTDTSGASLTIPTPVANAILQWNNAGTALQNATLGGSGTIAVPAGTGLAAYTGANTFVARTLTAGAGVTVTNGDGQAGNPTVALIGAMTTKGDLHTYDTGPVRKAVGSNGQVLVPDSAQPDGLRWSDPWARGILAGCQLTWVSTTSLTLGAGTCRDDADTETMKFAALTMSNLTVGWVVGNNQPKIRTGVVLANGMTLHVYVIKRTDTGAVDWFLSDEASAPTLPTSYTKSRRVASIRFGAGAQTIPQFIQDGDYFRWAASVLDVNTTNPGTAAVSSTLTVPTGVNVHWFGNVRLFSTTITPRAYFSDLAATDEAVSDTAAPLAGFTSVSTAASSFAAFQIRTNTSAQIRYRLDSSDANTAIRIATLGWLDRRGRDA